MAVAGYSPWLQFTEQCGCSSVPIKETHLSRKSGCCECSGILQQTLYVTSPHLIEQLVDQDAVLPHSLLAQHTAVVLQAMQNGIAASAQHSHRRPKQCGISRL